MSTIEKKFPWQKKLAQQLLVLEPRLLFDGAAIAVAIDTSNQNSDSSNEVSADANTAAVQTAQAEQADGSPEANKFDSSASITPVTDAGSDPEVATSTSIAESISKIDSTTEQIKEVSPVQLVMFNQTPAISMDVSEVWSQALAGAQRQILEFAKSDRYLSVLQQIYNPRGEDLAQFNSRAEELRQQILGQGLNIAVELRSAVELDGNMAAYAAKGEDGREKIYVDQSWIEFGLDSQMVSRALVEEIGHAIDQRLNQGRDTVGDEGEYFSRLINNDVLSADDLQQLTTENDSAIAFIDGQSIEVEHASITFTKAYQGMNSSYTAVGTTYGIQTSSIYIGTAISSSAYTFQSANPADVTFSGNNVAGQITYYSGGIKYSFNGVISRPDKTGNTPMALYFAETSVLGGSTPTGKAFLLVMPGYESTYGTNRSISTSSDPIANALNDVLTSEASNRPPVISSNGGGDSATISYQENTPTSTAVTTVIASDLDGGTLTYSIYGGADAALFTIDGSTGALKFKASPNYEAPLDADRNNIYDVRVMVADPKGATDMQTLSVYVTNVNDNAPVITSNGGGSSASISVAQSTVAVTKVTSTDADVGDVAIYSIPNSTAGGADRALFSIDPNTGSLVFNSAPVYNVSGNNTYYVNVTVTDGAGNTDTQNLTVIVTNADNVAPTLAITSDKSLLGSGATATITFTFSEAVKNFDLSDVTVAGGSLSNLVQDPSYPTIYRATFTQSGSVSAPSFTVAANTYQDIANNNGSAASLSLGYDVIAPTVSVDIAGTDIAFGQTKTVTFTFSEDPAGTFTIDDIATTNGLVTNLVQSPTDPKVFTASIQSTSATGGPVVVAVAGSYTDAAGNLGSEGSDTATLVSPSIDLANTSTSDTGSSSVDNITSNTKPVIEGSATANTALTITVESGALTLTYLTTSNASGLWSINLSTASPSSGSMPSAGLNEGYVGLTVGITSTLGGSSPVTASSSFLIDFTPPSRPTVTAQTASTSTPTIAGTTDSATDVLQVTVNGVTYTSGDGYLTYVKGSTTWSLAIPAINALSTNTYSVTATSYDLAGNSIADNTSSELVVSLTTAAPIVDLAPSDGSLNNAQTYNQGGSAVGFSLTGANISDADSTNLASLTIAYTTTSFEAGDRLELGATNIYLYGSTSSGTVYYNGTYFNYGFTTVGSTNFIQFTSRNAGNTSNAVAAVASYEALLDAVRFSNNAATFTNGSTRVFSVTANDGTQSSGPATFTVTMVAANHAPALDATVNPTLTGLSEDAIDPVGSVGTLVSSLVSGIADIDIGSAKGIAITGINSANGTLYYTLDGGTTWNSAGTVSSGSALLLASDANTRLYFKPSANFNGSISNAITFCAWDQTSGSAGSKVDTTTNGGSTAFSSTTDTVALTVTAVNDAPVASGSATLSADLEDVVSPTASTVATLFASNFSDTTDTVSGGSSANTLAGIAITSYTVDTSKGNWQYSSDGSTWTTISSSISAATSALSLKSADYLRFVPAANWNGAAPALTVKLIDSSTTVTTAATVDATGGGTTAYSSGTVVLSHSVTAVNDAPVASGSATLASVSEDAASPSGSTVSSLFASNFSDTTDTVSGGSSANTLAGIAITSYTADSSKGSWEYTTDGTNWTAIGTVSGTSALTLGVGSNDKLRFVPAANWNGAAPTLTVRLIDASTTVTSGATGVNVSSNGGTTAISSATVSLGTSVTAVNDAPVASGSATLSADLEDVVSPTASTVATLFASNFSDTTDTVSGGSSANTLAGIAITSYTVDTSKGNWQYSSDGSTWTTISSSISAATSALSLKSADYLRFVPAANWNGAAPALTVKLIDSSTTVTTAATVDATGGGTTAYSSGTVVLSHSVTAVNDAPVASGSATLASVSEDAASPSGSTVSSLFASNFSDTTDTVSGGSSANTLAGIAITSYTADSSKGSWEYTTDGTNWTAIGTVSGTSALTLGVGSNDKLRFVPAANWNGAAPTLTVRLIDASTTVTSGATGVNVSSNGGTTAISSATVSLGTSVTAVNDAPVASGSATLSADLEDVVSPTASTVATLFASNFSDTTDTVSGGSSANTLAGIAITSYTVDTSKGNWQYSSDGSTWTTISSSISAATSALSLKSADYLRFVPAANWNGAAPALTVKLIDSSTTVTTAATVDATGGGTTAYSSGTVVLSHSVTAVNDAPVASGSATLASVSEDAASPSGSTVSSLFASNFSDTTDTVSGGSSANTLAGIAITSYTADSSKGSWEYTTDGTNWTAIGTVSGTSALTLGVGSNDKLRFVPAANWNGAAPTLTVRLIDASTTVTSGATGVNVSSNGGTTAISSATVSLGTSVTAVNDAPVASGSATLSADLEDVVSPTASTVATLFASNFSDTTDTVSGGSSANTLAGIAITSYTVDTSKGNWQYSSDGSTWTTISSSISAATSALSLKSADYLRFVPAANWNGAAPALTVKLIDSSTTVTTAATVDATGGGTTAYSSGTVVLSHSVTAVNDAPVASDDAISTIKNTSYTNTLPSAIDVDGDLINYAVVANPSHGTVSINTNGSFTYTPASNYSGSDTFTYSVSDGNGGSNTYTVSVLVLASNSAPINTVPSSFTVNEDQAINLTGISVNDVDGNLHETQLSVLHGTLDINLSGGATISAGQNGTATLTINGTQSQINAALATLSYTGVANYNGSDVLTVLSTDSAGTPLSDVDTVALTVTAVNDAPVASGSATLSADLEDVVSPTASTVATLFASNFSDTTDTVSGGSSANTLAGIAITSYTVDTSKGNWQYSSDGSTWTTISSSISAATSALSLKSADYLRFVPAANWNGAAPALTVKLIDSSTTVTTAATVDATGGGTTAYSSGTVVLSHSVTAVNDAPVASGSATLASVSEDAASPSGSTVSSLFASNFSDTTDTVSGGSSANTLAGIAITSYTADSSKGSWEYTTDGTNWTAIGTVSGTSALTLGVGSNDKLRFVPAANWNGAAPTLTVRLIDASTTVTSGATGVNVSSNGGTTAISSATVSLGTSVTAVNDAPVASDDAISTIKNTSYTNTLPSAIDVDGDLINYAVVANPSHGTVSINTNGSFTYTPASNYSGSDTFTYSVSDGNGGSNTYTVSVLVLASNSAPINTVPSSFTVNEDQAINLTGISVNDVDGNLHETQLSVLHGTLDINLSGGATISAGQNGTATLTINGTQSQINAALATLSYTGVANYNGSDVLTVLSTDSAGTPLSDVDTVALTVTAVNDAPVAVDDGFRLSQGSQLTGNIIDNDLDYDDPNSNLSISYIGNTPWASLPNSTNPTYSVGYKEIATTNGVLYINSSGSFFYIHNGTNSVSDGFTYRTTDPHSSTSNAASVSITISPISANSAQSKFIQPAIPKLTPNQPDKFKVANEDDKEEEELRRTHDSVKGAWAAKSQFTKPTLAQTALYDANPIEVASPKGPAIQNPAQLEGVNSGLKNTLTPPDISVGAGSRIDYQLPQGTFSGGHGAVNLIATLKDGSPLPSWAKFDGATGKLTGNVPASLSGVIEIKIQARDTKGDKAETTLKIKPKLDSSSLTGKQNIHAQIKNAHLLRL